MTMCKYDFTQGGINAMYHDTLDIIFSALSEENKDFTIDELEIKISIADKEISVPLYADAFEALFLFLEETHAECVEIGAKR